MSPPPPVVFKSMSFEGAPAIEVGPAPIARPALASAEARAVAGTIDLVGGAVLLVLVAASVGTFDTSPGLIVRLDGAATWLWAALVLLSSFLAEALSDGRTIGKAVMGLRVVDARNGGRPTLRALAARSLLRLVDGLPFFYALGALVLLVSPDRQRIGDIAARTVVVRDRP